MNNEIKFIISELEVIYGFYQDKFSLERIKKYILSMPDGSKIVKVEEGTVPMYEHNLTLPIGQFSDDTDSVSLLLVTHTMVQNRDEAVIASDTKRVVDLVSRLLHLISPKE
ncbi:hypothetical protein COSHB9_23830 [Companilactobacillus alimentarius]|uniref:Uncharacterized protein n=1 Tax=Companilactobacillus alimentarius DSM 20249 TaxID=1423720 RepID=A0A2K9HP63_9LACO|nr:hypothetical protein [Companilactobacillus alimentarius]AUI71072.1 hypothetical protein LA20249_02150 [Companilactobacillus alimentarius DSM 20249]KRK75192.1 hypothetical protein FC67_GL001705 [Companilactobacillus alimentarius DSM 20249]MDT6951671.1 hypothetical protein [Companilactobacillus alimentarius]GEO44031.1 hypothetical protein LAL01_02630 [Companilactobacillus alimentarius]